MRTTNCGETKLLVIVIMSRVDVVECDVLIVRGNRLVPDVGISVTEVGFQLHQALVVCRIGFKAIVAHIAAIFAQDIIHRRDHELCALVLVRFIQKAHVDPNVRTDVEENSRAGHLSVCLAPKKKTTCECAPVGQSSPASSSTAFISENCLVDFG